MKASRARIDHAIARVDPAIRLILLYGPDRSGSEAIAAKLFAAMGPGAERVDLVAAELRGDPARLADEAASISMFGDKRLIRVDNAGEEMVVAAQALLEVGEAGNLVVAIAGELRATGKLLKLAHASAAALALASYPLEGREGDRLALDLARAAGLRMAPDLAHRLAAASGGDRAVLAQEIEKLALFADAAPERPQDATHAMLDALGAANDEGSLSLAINLAIDGDIAGLDAELARLAGVGVTGVPVVRALLRRLTLLAKLRAEVERGRSADAVVERAGRAIFWKERAQTVRQLEHWRADMLARAIERAMAAQHAIMRGGGPGTIAVDAEMFALAGVARRARGLRSAPR